MFVSRKKHGRLSPPVSVEITVFTFPTVSTATIQRATKAAVNRVLADLDSMGINAKYFDWEAGSSNVNIGMQSADVPREEMTLVRDLTDRIAVLFFQAIMNELESKS